MFFPPHLAPEFIRMIKPIWESDHPDHIKLRVIWGMLNGAQGAVIAQILAGRLGNKVFAGPFRGMQLIKEAMTWNFAPVLLGSYEWELHEIVEKTIVSGGAKKIINVGCAYGYYSVGLAMRMPQATVYAYDIDPDMREQCRAMAELNGVADRVVIGERFSGGDYARFDPQESFILMDIEGAEMDLLDPVTHPASAHFNFLVELHDCNNPDISTTILGRYGNTHDTKIIPNTPFNFPLGKVLGEGYVPDHFDNLLATWENRGGPTPYGLFLRR